MRKKRYIAAAVFFIAGVCLAPAGCAHADAIGQNVQFFVSKNFDGSGRTRVSATLVKVAPQLYFYAESSWWLTRPPQQQNEILANLESLSQEFSNHIYPTLTGLYGPEWTPGVDNDSHITIFFESMQPGMNGYLRTNDEYLTLQVPDSNEREMLYLSQAHVDDPQLKRYVAHEFTHLITFNQKNRLRGVQEDTWLNEARADYSSTMLGYDDTYPGSNLQGRVQDFLQDPAHSLTGWQESKYDYAIDSMVTHYLVDRYSVSVLSYSMQSGKVGVASINDALAKLGVQKTFSQIFTDWSVAILLNDCSGNTDYCYLSQNLKNIRLTPTLNFLPISANSSLTVADSVQDWAANWQKIIGGAGSLQVSFSGPAGSPMQVPYVLYKNDGTREVAFLQLDKNGNGQINLPDFSARYNSLVLIPSVADAQDGSANAPYSYPYTFTASVTAGSGADAASLIAKLRAEIGLLQTQIAALQQGTGSASSSGACTITANLYRGVTNASQVTCLQQFLKNQGAGIYPEGLVTGYFGPLTRSAVIRFQEAHEADILTPLGLTKGTGYVGPASRKEIAALIS